MTFALLLPAAGSGTRLGATLPKTLLEIAGKPLFVRAADLLVRHPDHIETVIAAPAGHEPRYRELAAAAWPGRNVRVIAGGRVRQESVTLALNALEGTPDVVLVHDAARIFPTLELIERVLGGVTGNFVAALPGMPLTDTVKRVSGIPTTVIETVPRSNLMAVQTPQALRRDVMLEAHRLAARDEFEGTDDVSLVERYDLGPVRVIDGDARNFKITTPEDLARARELLENVPR